MRHVTFVILSVFVSLALARAAAAGPYADATHGINYNDPRFVGWATGCTVTWPSGFTPAYNDPTKALGPAPASSNDVVTLGDCGTAVLTFSVVIHNTPGPDLAVFENGFAPSYDPTTLFAELAYVEVSTDGVTYVRFPSVSLDPNPGEYGAMDPTNIYNLAGKNINNNGQAWQGTPFDLDDLKGLAAVTSGLVDLNHINYVRIVDIDGDSSSSSWDNATSLIDPTTGTHYTTNHLIYDGGNHGGNITGFDLDAVGVLVNPVPEPGTVGLLASAAGIAFFTRRRTGRGNGAAS